MPAGPPLVAVAHGSRDARSAATVRHLVRRLRQRAPEVEVRVAFLDLSEPSLPQVLDELHAHGHREVTVVPLLLGTAYHARVDLPALIADVADRLPLLRVTVGDVLGPDELLEAATRSRLTDALADHPSTGHPSSDVGVVLAAVGSSHPPANAAVAAIADRWDRAGGFAAVTHAFATCSPDIDAAVARLRDRGVARVAVAPWFLAPGLLLDDIGAQARRADARAVVAAPLGAHDLVVEVVLRRYAAAGVLAAAA